VVSRLTGLPLETLRAWERRYGFPMPRRKTDSNRRLYTQGDIDRLKLISQALAQGYRPGDVIHHPEAKLRSLLGAAGKQSAAQAAALPPDPSAAPTVDSILAQVKQYDAALLESELRRAAAMLGPRRFVVELAHPLVVAIGSAWENRQVEIGQEHLLTQTLRTQLRTMMVPFQDMTGRPTVVLATLPGEEHELGLELVSLYLSLGSAKPRLLGRETPVEEIMSASRALGADIVGITVTSAAPFERTSEGLGRLLAELPRRVGVWAGGLGAAPLAALHPGVQVMSSWADIDAALAALRLTLLG
jgi:DNA-binding transcriptional MerR regulator/methylmalonyl-CoA mutase cobalamin-binding subunit